METKSLPSIKGKMSPVAKTLLLTGVIVVAGSIAGHYVYDKWIPKPTPKP